MQALVEQAGSLGLAQRDTFVVAEARAANPPSELVPILDAISDVTRKINVVTTKLEVQIHMTPVADISGGNELEQKITTLRQLSTNLETISTGRTILISHLQQPFAGSGILIEAPQQEVFVNLISSITKGVACMEQYHSAIAWLKKFSLADGQLVQALDSIVAFLARAQRYHYALQNTRESVQRLHTTAAQS